MGYPVYNYDPASDDNTPTEYEVARTMEIEVAIECGKRLAKDKPAEQRLMVKRLFQYVEEGQHRDLSIGGNFLRVVWERVKAETWIRPVNCRYHTGVLWQRAIERLYMKMRFGTFDLIDEIEAKNSDSSF